MVAKYLLKINLFSLDSDIESIEDQMVEMLRLGEVVKLRPPWWHLWLEKMRTRRLNWCLCCPQLFGVLHQGMKQWKGCSPKGCHLAFGSQTANLRESSFSVTQAVVFWYGSRQQAETILVSLTSADSHSHTFGNRMCKERVGKSDSLGRRRKHWYRTVKRSSGWELSNALTRNKELL